MAPSTPTALLKAWRGGDRGALDHLMPVVYDELSRVARGALSGERRDHTLQTLALVHEAYLRLIDADVEWQDRAHFFDLDEALEKLAAQDERLARLVELYFYAGLNYEEAAEALGLSPATVGRELRVAKAWLARELKVKPA